MFALTLPLIIAHGKFTMLDDMKDDEMESFVSFLVKCDKHCSDQVEEPPWWLPNLPFVHPIKRPNKVTRKWRHKLKSLIKKCYKYYDCELLIDLSANLAREQQNNNIKFIIKCSHLTSVYNKAKSMIIVTIRNENLTYDLDSLNDNFIKTRKLNRMCYSCNRLATVLVEDSSKRCKLEPENVTPLPSTKESCTQNEFLNMFELTSKENDLSVFVVNPPPSNYGRINFTKAPYIPFSSQLGRRLATKIKYFVQDTTHMKRLERLGRYLSTSSVPTTEYTRDSSVKPRVHHSKPSNQWYHTYKFPGKTYKSHLKNYMDSKYFLLNKCKPCYVSVVPFDYTSGNSKTECIDLTKNLEDDIPVKDPTKDQLPQINKNLEPAFTIKKGKSKVRTNEKQVVSSLDNLNPIIVIDKNDNGHCTTNENKTSKTLPEHNAKPSNAAIIKKRRKRRRKRKAKRKSIRNMLGLYKNLRSQKK